MLPATEEGDVISGLETLVAAPKTLAGRRGMGAEQASRDRRDWEFLRVGEGIADRGTGQWARVASGGGTDCGGGGVDCGRGGARRGRAVRGGRTVVHGL